MVSGRRTVRGRALLDRAGSRPAWCRSVEALRRTGPGTVIPAGSRVESRAMQATPLARPRRIASQWALYLGPWLGLAGCRTMPPTETWVTALESGLREPAGTFATFRAAFCAGAPELEYRCLSREFRRELGIDSQLVY